MELAGGRVDLQPFSLAAPVLPLTGCAASKDAAPTRRGLPVYRPWSQDLSSPTAGLEPRTQCRRGGQLRLGLDRLPPRNPAKERLNVRGEDGSRVGMVQLGSDSVPGCPSSGASSPRLPTPSPRS